MIYSIVELHYMVVNLFYLYSSTMCKFTQNSEYWPQPLIWTTCCLECHTIPGLKLLTHIFSVALRGITRIDGKCCHGFFCSHWYHFHHCTQCLYKSVQIIYPEYPEVKTNHQGLVLHVEATSVQVSFPFQFDIPAATYLIQISTN